MRIHFLTVIFIFSLSHGLMAQCGGSDVGGKVFLDLAVDGSSTNTYGQLDANEPGLPGITVTVTDVNGATQTATTDANGDWTVSAPAFPVRVEFTWNASWLKESYFGAGENTSVRTVTAADCNVNLGLHDPNDYSTTPNPDYVESIRISGSGVGNNMLGVGHVPYDAMGLNANEQQYDGTQGTGPVPTTDATVEEVGTIWGKAYQASQKRLFMTPTLWRHAGFAPGTGPGHLFIMDYSSPTGSLMGTIDLQGLTPANGGAPLDFGSVCRGGGCENDPGNTGSESDYILDPDPTTPNIDLDAFAKAATIGFGDLDYDATSQRLWAINLYQKGIIEIDVSGDTSTIAAKTKQYLIESLPGVPSCTGGELRPWAIKTYRDKVYIGCVCDAINSQDIDDAVAYVLSFDPNNVTAGFTTEFTLPLNYDKDDLDWNPWSNTYNPDGGGYWKYYPQPILSNIDFDENGNMYLAFLDRWGLQAAPQNYKALPGTTETETSETFGELFKICNNNGTFELEGTGSCPTNYTNETDEFFNDIAGDAAADACNGAITLLPGRNQLLAHIVDPHPEGSTGQDYWNTQGVNTYSTTDGSIQNWYSFLFGLSNGSVGKGVGLGDIELLTEPAPIEIGDLVWLDTDGDGVQDPDETGIAGVTIELLDDSDNVIATAVTDANGHYIFSNDPNGTDSDSQKYGLALSPNTTYKIRIPNASGGSQQSAIQDLSLTSTDTGEGGTPDINDNDGNTSGTDAIISVPPDALPSTGANNHSLDFGFKPQQQTVEYDWGDLPDPAAGTAQGDYESLAANNGPSHQISSDIYLGTSVTAENDAQPNADATGDTDDGITMNSATNWTPGTTMHLPVSATNNTASTGQLEAWIDWNGDGDFDDANEMVANLDDTGGSFPATLDITVPADAVQDQPIGFRIRLSTQDDMTPYGVAPNGEVEDYMITISCPPTVCLPVTIQKH